MLKDQLRCCFCGGLKCKHENFLNHPSPYIIGLNSDLITSDLIASQRPSTVLLHKYNIINQFKTKNIGLIVNLQREGEHPYCGPNGTLESSGFTYFPNTFISEGIDVILRGWKDMDVPESMSFMMSIVKTMYYYSKILKKKILVHCHAGYGRTGIVLACYLIYCGNNSVDSIVKQIRQVRKKCIEKTAQYEYCEMFYNYVNYINKLFFLPVNLSRKEIEKIEELYYSNNTNNTINIDNNSIVINNAKINSNSARSDTNILPKTLKTKTEKKDKKINKKIDAKSNIIMTKQPIEFFVNNQINLSFFQNKVINMNNKYIPFLLFDCFHHILNNSEFKFPEKLGLLLLGYYCWSDDDEFHLNFLKNKINSGNWEFLYHYDISESIIVELLFDWFNDSLLFLFNESKLKLVFENDRNKDNNYKKEIENNINDDIISSFNYFDSSTSEFIYSYNNNITELFDNLKKEKYWNNQANNDNNNNKDNIISNKILLETHKNYNNACSLRKKKDENQQNKTNSLKSLIKALRLILSLTEYTTLKFISSFMSKKIETKQLSNFSIANMEELLKSKDKNNSYNSSSSCNSLMKKYLTISIYEKFAFMLLGYGYINYNKYKYFNNIEIKSSSNSIEVDTSKSNSSHYNPEIIVNENNTNNNNNFNLNRSFNNKINHNDHYNSILPNSTNSKRIIRIRTNVDYLINLFILFHDNSELISRIEEDSTYSNERNNDLIFNNNDKKEIFNANEMEDQYNKDNKDNKDNEDIESKNDYFCYSNSISNKFSLFKNNKNNFLSTFGNSKNTTYNNKDLNENLLLSNNNFSNTIIDKRVLNEIENREKEMLEMHKQIEDYFNNNSTYSTDKRKKLVDSYSHVVVSYNKIKPILNSINNSNDVNSIPCKISNNINADTKDV